jgi:8-oxo-dGTP diphosphatase
MKSNYQAAYGGVVFDSDGRVLLREPTGHYGQYIWTFPKGKGDPGESPEQAALREVLEETGCQARIVAPIPGDFVGDTSVNRYFLMMEMIPGAPFGSPDSETAQVRWATQEEAKDLIGLTPNVKGRARDLAILDTAVSVWIERRAKR